MGVCVMALSATASAQDAPATAATRPAEATQPAVPSATPAPASEDSPEEREARRWDDGSACSDDAENFTEGVRLCGYVEAFYSYNFNAPSNGVTALRFYDDRHDLLSLQNVVLGAAFRHGPVRGHLTLQTGVFTESFGDPPRGADLDLLWRLLQEVTLRWDTGLLARGEREGVSIEGGLFVAPFTVEDMGAWERWNWTTSNLFAVSPFQIAGARVGVGLSPTVTMRAGVYNGWDQIVSDTSAGKSFLVDLTWEHPTDDHFFTVQYWAGVERDRGSPEGDYFRHVVDAYGRWTVNRHVALQANVFTGLEPNRFGLQGWFGAALFARFRVLPWLRVAVRGDILHEWRPDGAEAVFTDMGGAALVASGTATFDVRPAEHLSIRAEFRHDEADGDVFYQGTVPTDPVSGLSLPTARSQDTFLLGVTAWF